MYVDLGTVKPGTTLFVPFHTFDSNDPSASTTITGLAVTDIEIYKDASMTQRGSDAGYSLVDTDGIDIDTITGFQGFTVNLADNTTAGFYSAGSDYVVVVSSVTVDAATINFIAARFRIGYEAAILNTTIATLSSQTSFTLTTGPAEDDAINGMWCIIHDVASAVQMGYGVISDYTGSTKTITLVAGTTFTAAATDNISIMGPMPLQPTVFARTLDVTATGAAGIDWGNIENKTTANDLSATDIQLVDTVTTYTGNTVQTGDSFARIGAPAGASVSADILVIDNFVDDLETRLTSARAGYLDNLNGHVAQTGDSYARIGATGSGLTTLATQASVNTIDDFLDTEIAAIKNKTDFLPSATAGDAGGLFIAGTNAATTITTSLTTTFTGNLTGSVGSVTGAVGSVTGAVGSVAAGGITASSIATGAIDADAIAADAVTEIQAGLATPTNITAGTITTVTNLTNAPTNGDLTATMKASVNTEVLDVLNTDTFAEPAQGAPGATVSLVTKIGFLYKAWRNKTTSTATQYNVYNDDTTTIDHKSTLSDDGTTATKTEVVSGP